MSLYLFVIVQVEQAYSENGVFRVSYDRMYYVLCTMYVHIHVLTCHLSYCTIVLEYSVLQYKYQV